MVKMLMCRRLQRKNSKPNFFSTPNLENFQKFDNSACISLVLWVIHRISGVVVYPAFHVVFSKREKKGNVVASIMGRELCKGHKTWFPPIGRPTKKRVKSFWKGMGVQARTKNQEQLKN